MEKKLYFLVLLWFETVEFSLDCKTMIMFYIKNLCIACTKTWPCLFPQSYNEGSAYIATQGPAGNTINDFWRMVWEQRSTVVVMLTDLQDNGVVISV